MNAPKVVVLFVRGNPLATVWLPSDRALEGVTVEALPGETMTETARRWAKVKVLAPVIRLVSLPRELGSGDMCISWVQDGQSPHGLEAVPFEAALVDVAFGPYVEAIADELRRWSQYS